MTYLQFHLIFNLPALVCLLWLNRRRLDRTYCQWIGVVCIVAFLATTPWDNWAVHRGMWRFAGERVHMIGLSAGGVLWQLPAEEYAFFAIETVLVSLVTLLLLPIPTKVKTPASTSPPPPTRRAPA